MSSASPPVDLVREVRLYVFRQAAETTRVPQPPQIAQALGRPLPAIQEAVSQLAAGKVLILAPNDSNIWSANPFCAVPSGFRVQVAGKTYWGICIYDAMGIAAALAEDARIQALCGDCGKLMTLDIQGGALAHSEGLVHFAVPVHHWWDNIAFTSSTMLLFRGEEHIDRWCVARELPRGAVLTPQQCWRLAHGWYEDKLKPDWRRHNLEETETLLPEVGLSGPFWNLRE